MGCGFVVATSQFSVLTFCTMLPIDCRHEISCFLRRISSHLPICDTSDIRCVAYENVKIIAVVRPMFTATRRVTVTSKIGDWEVNLRIKFHISYTDQLVVPAISNYLLERKMWIVFN